ncbi:MAG: hypothetical protein WB629_04480 [Candidatus Sulfotelmatobacter sp.]
MQSTTTLRKAVPKVVPIVACVILTAAAANGVTIQEETWSKPCAETEEMLDEVVQVDLDELGDLSYTEASLRTEFQELVKEWKETRAATSAAQMATTPAYLQIIGLGPSALPLILEQLKSEGASPSHWFIALRSIARANPIPQESRGKLLDMAKAWLAWGEKQGYV